MSIEQRIEGHRYQQAIIDYKIIVILLLYELKLKREGDNVYEQIWIRLIPYSLNKNGAAINHVY